MGFIFGGIDERYYKINQIYGYFIYEKANRLYDILLLNTVLTLVYPSCISVIVDQGVAKGSIEDIIKYSILMFVLGILIMITNFDVMERIPEI